MKKVYIRCDLPQSTQSLVIVSNRDHPKDVQAESIAIC